MGNENKVAEPKTEEVVVPETTEAKTEEVDWKAKAEKAEELANNYKIRAEKAEKAAKTAPEVKAVEAKGDLSALDTIAIINAKVPTEDIQEVVDYAKFKGVSVKEALGLDAVKATLALKAEQRKTANAAHVGNARKGSTEVPDDVVLSKARSGDLPQSDDGIERLTEARLKSKIKK